MAHQKNLLDISWKSLDEILLTFGAKPVFVFRLVTDVWTLGQKRLSRPEHLESFVVGSSIKKKKKMGWYYLRKRTAQKNCDFVDAGGSKNNSIFYKVGGYELNLT